MYLLMRLYVFVCAHASVNLRTNVYIGLLVCVCVCVYAVRVKEMRAPVEQKYAQNTQQLSVLTQMVFSGKPKCFFLAVTVKNSISITLT